MSDDEMGSKHDTEIKVARINARQIIIVTAITAIAGLAGAFLQGTFSTSGSNNPAEVSELRDRIQQLEKELSTATTLYQLTADYLEGSLKFTAGKERIIDEETDLKIVRYKRLKRSIFLNMRVLQANQTILEHTLEQLEKRGYSWVSDQTPRLVAEFPKIKTQRLRWLEDKAIPALEQEIASTPPMVQSVPQARVPLPQDLWIFDHEPGEEPVDNVGNLAALEEEVKLIKESL